MLALELNLSLPIVRYTYTDEYPRADKVLARLLAISEYDHFCDMMRRAHGEMVDVDDPDAGYYT